MALLLIGLDDTDNATSRGTGHLARLLLGGLGRRGLRPVGVSRHQLLLDPRIPYTSHNSAACVAVEADGADAPHGTAEWAFRFVAERAADGSDPGVCVAPAETVGRDVTAFGRRAAREVLEMDAAFALARAAGLALRALGGTGQGVIGALAAVGLRADGCDGRVIDMPGLRQLPRRVRREDFARLGIELEHRGRAPGAPDRYDTLEWVRPRLTGGRCLLPVVWSERHDAWIPVDRKRSRPLE